MQKNDATKSQREALAKIRKDRTFGITLLKDWSESVKVRATFFFPFFAAFIAFMVAKTDYLLNANAVLIAICLVTFGCGILYAAFVSETLWMADSLRFILAAKEHTDGETPGEITDKEYETFKEVSKVLVKRLSIDYKLFRWMMWILYIASTSIIWDLFFAKTILAWMTKLIARFIH